MFNKPSLLTVGVLLSCLASNGTFLQCADAAPATETDRVQISTTLAAEESSSQLFMFAAVNGGIDYFNAQRKAPVSLADVQAAGYIPYLLPEISSFTWEVLEGRYIRAVSLHKPVYWHGKYLPSRQVSLGFPPPGLSRSLPGNKHGVSSAPRKIYYFEASRYLEQGADLSDLPSLQRRLRTLLHLSALALEYAAAHDNRLPGSIAAMEKFQGLARNPVAWKDCFEVSSVSEASSAGAIFFGHDADGKPCILVNLGWGIERVNFVQDRANGQWRVENRILFY
jgi:hypothetical protein